MRHSNGTSLSNRTRRFAAFLIARLAFRLAIQGLESGFDDSHGCFEAVEIAGTEEAQLFVADFASDLEPFRAIGFQFSGASRLR